MNYKKESQFTNNASKRVFEEVYTNEDMNDRSISGQSYRLNVPQMFANNPSQEKAVSPRRVMCEPSSHIFKLAVIYYDDQDDEIGRTLYSMYDFTSQNTMEEILHRIADDSTCGINNGPTYDLQYEYDKSTGKLRFIPVSSEEDDVIQFAFSCPSFEHYDSFWRLLNQTGSPFNIGLTDPDDFTPEAVAPDFIYELQNVWSREPLYVHATFSNSKKHYLCRTGDFWFKPSKYYYDNINQNDFERFFTTDGSHRIVPHDAVKIVEICFILRQFARL